MKSAIVILVLAVASYVWHLGQIRQLRATHDAEITALKTAHLARLEPLEHEYETTLAELESAQREMDGLTKLIDELEARLDAIPTAAPQPSVAPSIPAPTRPAPAAAPVVDPGTEAAALRVRRAALESQIDDAKRVLNEWRTKANLEEQSWASQSSGVRLAPAERAKRRAEVQAAITAKESELLRLQSQLAALPR
jgi:chromosome segregation ATPase